MKEERSEAVIFKLNGYEVMSVIFMYFRCSAKRIQIAESCIVNGNYVLYEDFMCMYAPSFFMPIDVRFCIISKAQTVFTCNDKHFKRYPMQSSDIVFNQNQR